MNESPIQEWQFEKEKVTLKNVYPSAILTVEKKGRNREKYITKTVIYNIEKNGEVTYTAKEMNPFLILGIRGSVQILQRIITEGRKNHPGITVFEILKMHYDKRAAQSLRIE